MAPKRPRSAETSTSQTPRFRSEAHRVRFQTLSTFEFKPTCYLDEEALRTTGLWAEVSRYISAIGWEGVASMRFATYREPVLEFLSSVAYVESDGDEEEPEDRRIHFQLDGATHDIPLAQFNVYCRFCTVEFAESAAYQEALTEIPTAYTDDGAWHEITGTRDRYLARFAKSTAIRDPALRVIHRWLVHSIFGRKDSTGNVSSHHLFILWCMIHQHRVNPGRFLLLSCTSLGSKLGTEKTGFIVLGAFISRLARSMGRLPDTAMRLFEMQALSYDTFYRMGILVKGASGDYVLAAPAAPPAAEDVAAAPQQPAPEAVAPAPDPTHAERSPPPAPAPAPSPASPHPD